MATTSPNLGYFQLVDPIAYTAVDGTWPNPEEYVLSELQRITGELRAGFQADDAAIVAYFNAQLEQVNSLINGLAGGTELQQAVELLNNIANIVDADGNGILDALGPLNETISGLQSTVAALQTTQQAQQTAIDGLQTSQSAMQFTLTNTQETANLAQNTAENNAERLVAVANTLGHNLQAIRNAFQSVNVNYTPIALPDPVFATTNVTGGSGDAPSDPANL